MRKLLVAPVLVFSILLSFSSVSTSQTPTPIQQSPQDVKKTDTFETVKNSSWVETVKNSSWGIVTAAAAIVIAGVATAIAADLKIKIAKIKKSKQEELEKTRRETEEITLNSLRRPIPLNENEKRNCITIVGIGGTGKTTLIKKMFDKNAPSEIATRVFTRYFSIKESSIYSLKIKFNYYVTDYMGQNIGTLIQGMMQEQKIPYSPMTWGAINSIIFLVDVADPPDSLGVQHQTPWKERVKRHIREWSPTALDAIFGLVDIKNLQYVCLLVSKFDLLQNVNEQEIKLEYKELIDAIAVRCRGVCFKCLVGNIYSEDFRNYLEEDLQKYSYPK